MKVLSAISVLALALAASSAQAVTYYYSKCDTVDGDAPHASCVPGSESNNGTSPATPKLELPTSYSANNTYMFNRAGGWDNFAYKAVSNRANVTLTAYTPASCTGDCETRKPRLGAALDVNGCPTTFFFLTGSNSNWVISNLHFKGKQTVTTVSSVANGGLACGTNRAIYFYASGVGSNDNARVQGNVFERLFLPIHVTVAAGTPGDQANRNIKFIDNDHNYSAGQGFFGGAKNMLIESSRFDGNAWEQTLPGFDSKDEHHLYVSSSGVEPAQGMILRGNYFTNQQRQPGAGSSTCVTSTVMGHGNMPDLTVEYNFIYEPTASNKCWGLVFDGQTDSSSEPQKLDRLRVRGNKIVLQTMGLGIGCSSCPDAIIENNMLVALDGVNAAQGIAIGTITSASRYQPARGDSAPGKTAVRNNSIYLNNSSGTSLGACVGFWYTNYSVPAPSNYGTVTNNLCVYGTLMPASAKCFHLGGEGPSKFDAFSNNICTKAGATPTWSDNYATLGAFETAFGAKAVANSVTDSLATLTLPTIGNNWVLSLLMGSPAINASNATWKATHDMDRYLPVGVRDIGAVEFNRTTLAPAGPTGGRVN